MYKLPVLNWNSIKVYFNFANYISDDIVYNDDLFFKTLQYEWKTLYEDVIKELLNEDEKKEYIFFE